MIPLWKQALLVREAEQRESSKARQGRGPKGRYMGGYRIDERETMRILADVLARWGVQRSEINRGRPGDERNGFPLAARTEALRECWRAKLAPLSVAKLLRISPRTVRRRYAECRRRLGPVACQIPNEPESGVKVA